LVHVSYDLNYFNTITEKAMFTRSWLKPFITAGVTRHKRVPDLSLFLFWQIQLHQSETRGEDLLCSW